MNLSRSTRLFTGKLLYAALSAVSPPSVRKRDGCSVRANSSAKVVVCFSVVSILMIIQCEYWELRDIEIPSGSVCGSTKDQAQHLQSSIDKKYGVQYHVVVSTGTPIIVYMYYVPTCQYRAFFDTGPRSGL